MFLAYCVSFNLLHSSSKESLPKQQNSGEEISQRHDDAENDEEYDSLLDDNDMDITEIDHALQDNKASASSQRNQFKDNKVKNNSTTKDEQLPTCKRCFIHNAKKFVSSIVLINRSHWPSIY